MDQIGFHWETQYRPAKRKKLSTVVRDKKFLDMVEKVKCYVRKHGNGYIPQRCQEDERLGFWAYNRRVEERDGKLADWKRSILLSAGFSFEKTGHVSRVKSSTKGGYGFFVVDKLGNSHESK